MDGAEFKEKRQILGYSQQKLADILGLTQRQIANYEGGKHKIKKIYGEKISQFVDEYKSRSTKSEILDKELDLVQKFRIIDKKDQKRLYDEILSLANKKLDLSHLNEE